MGGLENRVVIERGGFTADEVGAHGEQIAFDWASVRSMSSCGSSSIAADTTGGGHSFTGRVWNRHLRALR